MHTAQCTRPPDCCRYFVALAAREMPRWVRLACAGCVETTSWACAALYVGVLMAGKPRTEHPILTLVRQHGQSGRLGGGISGRHGLLRLCPKA